MNKVLIVLWALGVAGPVVAQSFKTKAVTVSVSTECLVAPLKEEAEEVGVTLWIRLDEIKAVPEERWPEVREFMRRKNSWEGEPFLKKTDAVMIADERNQHYLCQIEEGGQRCRLNAVQLVHGNVFAVRRPDVLVKDRRFLERLGALLKHQEK